MLRFIRQLSSALILALLAALIIGLWRAPDPVYRLQEWVTLSRYNRYDDLIRKQAGRQGADFALIKAIAWRESRFHPEKVGGAGERGLMQVGELAAMDWVNAHKNETFMVTDLYDAERNVEIGTWYLQRALERWRDRDDPVPFALAEYNAGRSNVDRWIAASGRGREVTAADLFHAIDYPTTKKYLAEITLRYRYYREHEDG